MERGLYERLANEQLEAALQALVGRHRAQRLDEGDSHAALAEHIAHLLTQVLRRQPAQDRLNHQVALRNRVVRVLSESDGTVKPSERTLPTDVRRFLSGRGDESAPPWPDTPLSETSLLTGTHTDPSIVSQHECELASAHRIDVLCSLIQWSDVGLPREALDTNRMGRIQIPKGVTPKCRALAVLAHDFGAVQDRPALQPPPGLRLLPTADRPRAQPHQRPHNAGPLLRSARSATSATRASTPCA